jgi:hypothetical protein
MTLYKLVSDQDLDTEIARGSLKEMEQIHSAFVRFGLRHDKLEILPVEDQPRPRHISFLDTL